jgi:hypothetical protein
MNPCKKPAHAGFKQTHQAGLWRAGLPFGRNRRLPDRRLGKQRILRPANSRRGVLGCVWQREFHFACPDLGGEVLSWRRFLDFATCFCFFSWRPQVVFSFLENPDGRKDRPGLPTCPTVMTVISEQSEAWNWLAPTLLCRLARECYTGRIGCFLRRRPRL